MTALDAQCATARDHIRAMARAIHADIAAWDLSWDHDPDPPDRFDVVVPSCTMDPPTPIDPLLGHLP